MVCDLSQLCETGKSLVNNRDHMEHHVVRSLSEVFLEPFAENFSLFLQNKKAIQSHFQIAERRDQTGAGGIAGRQGGKQTSCDEHQGEAMETYSVRTLYSGGQYGNTTRNVTVLTIEVLNTFFLSFFVFYKTQTQNSILP